MAARFFLNCIARPGTMCVQVAHDPAVGGGDIPHCAPAAGEPARGVRKGALTTSHANKRQIVFPHMDSRTGWRRRERMQGAG